MKKWRHINTHIGDVFVIQMELQYSKRRFETEGKQSEQTVILNPSEKTPALEMDFFQCPGDARLQAPLLFR